MPKYFFHTRDHDTLYEDLEGVQLTDDQVAIQEAIAAAREICAEKLKYGHEIDGQVFEITTEDGVVIGTVPFRSVLKI
ncbi:DUF6894 family protein [Pararhizobium arenae]|uniref:DUF6894 family protein n=1 Tax=Pararhizobium arenae TaxID=1856850 RepID=UPI00094B355A|nr:hypothetical protein [Pararhizobium arenae]